MKIDVLQYFLLERVNLQLDCSDGMLNLSTPFWKSHMLPNEKEGSLPTTIFQGTVHAS